MNLLRRLAEQGVSSAVIAKTLNRYISSIKRMAGKLGLILKK